MKYKSEKFFILILSFFLIGMNCVSESKKLSLIILVTFDNGKVTFEYLDTENYKVTITAKIGTWIGIGYGTGMKDTDMNIAEIIDNTNYTLKDCYSKGYSIPEEDTKLGGTEDLKIVEFSEDSNGNGVLIFTRALKTGDKYDKEITIDQSESIILAWGQGTVSYHGKNRMKSSMIISQGGDNPDVNDFNFFEFHGIILIILWTAFNFLGYISSRFLRHQKWWIWLHWLGSGTTAFLSIGVLAASIKYCRFII